MFNFLVFIFSVVLIGSVSGHADKYDISAVCKTMVQKKPYFITQFMNSMDDRSCVKLSKAIDDGSRDPNIYYVMGMRTYTSSCKGQLIQSQRIEVISNISTALNLGLSDTTALYYSHQCLAEILCQEGRFNEAINHVNSSFEFAKDSADSYILKAQVMSEKGNSLNVLGLLDTAIQKLKSSPLRGCKNQDISDCFAKKGFFLLSNKDYHSAINAFDSSIIEDGCSPFGYYVPDGVMKARGDALSAVGKNNEAKKSYGLAILSYSAPKNEILNIKHVINDITEY